MIAFVILFTANSWNTKHANCKLSSTIVGRWSQVILSCRIIVELFSISWLYIQFVISSKFIKKAFRMANGSSGGVISTLSKLVHLIAVVHFYYGLYYDMRYVFPPENHPLFHKISSWGGKFRYLTILGAVCIWPLIHSSREKISIFHNLINFLIVFLQIWQTFYFTLCVLNDFIGTNEYHPKRPSKLRQLKDYVFATFAFPLAMTVAISFWAIYAVDRELILPKAMESFFPRYLNFIPIRTSKHKFVPTTFLAKTNEFGFFLQLAEPCNAHQHFNLCFSRIDFVVPTISGS